MQSSGVFVGNSTFEGNTVESFGGGVLYAVLSNTVSFSGSSNFERNAADIVVHCMLRRITL